MERVKNVKRVEKGLRRKQGVYAIWVGDCVYVGSGYLGDRISGNYSKLRRGVHGNRMLQEAYNNANDKENVIKNEILQVCEDEVEAREMENYYIEYFRKVDGVIVCSKYKAVVNKPYKRALKPEDVLEIRKLIKEGVKAKDLAQKYGVTECQISRIKCGTRWGNV